MFQHFGFDGVEGLFLVIAHRLFDFIVLRRWIDCS